MTTTVLRDQIRVRSDGLYISKRHDEEIDYPINYGPWLAKQAGGDTIAQSTWEYPAGITVEGVLNSTSVTAAWISGGTRGQRYRIINRIVTAGGRTIAQTFYLEIDRRE